MTPRRVAAVQPHGMTAHSTPRHQSPGIARTGNLQMIGLLIGSTSIVAGGIAVFWPRQTVLVITVLFGLHLIVTGGLRVLEAVFSRSVPIPARLVIGFSGLLFVAVGGLFLSRP